MIYLLHVPTNIVIGTSLFQIIFVTAFTTILQSTTNHTVDIVLAFVLMLGGVIGAQLAQRPATGCAPTNCARCWRCWCWRLGCASATT